MPSNHSPSLNEATDEIRTLTFEQFEGSEPQSAPEKAQLPENGGTESDLLDQLPWVSQRKLYLMVMGDFGLSFTWLCKFAVATYVDSALIFFFSASIPLS